MQTTSNEEQQILPFEFDGKGMEYFKIWIVNICLTIVTLGIYSAWAKVRTNSYFYGNTILDNSRFAYLADPKRILKGRIISVILFGLYYAAWQFYPQAGIILLGVGCLLFPFFIVSAMSFRMSNTGYRNIRFHFEKNISGSYGVFLLPFGIMIGLTWLCYTLVDSMGLLDSMVNATDGQPEAFKKEDFIATAFLLAFLPVMPWLDFLRTRFIINHTQYGKAKAIFNAGLWNFIKVYLITFGLFLALIVFLFVIGVLGVVVLRVIDITLSESVLAAIFTISFYILGFFVAGIWSAMRTNMINTNTKFGENQLQSHLKGVKIGWIYLSNTLAIIFSLGMLIPWTKIRIAHYILSSTELQVRDLESIRAVDQEESSAFGEEMGDMFDMELGF